MANSSSISTGYVQTCYQDQSGAWWATVKILKPKMVVAVKTGHRQSEGMSIRVKSGRPNWTVA